MAGCDDTRQLTEAQRAAAFQQQQRAGVTQAVRPFTGKPTPESIADYLNRELFPAVKNTRGKLNEVFRQVADNAPSGNPLQFYFSTETAAADPTAGRVRLSSATQNASTTLRVSQSNGRLVDVAPWLDIMSGGATAPLGVITLTDAIDPSRFIRFDLTSMTDQGAYWDLTVVPVESSHTNPFVDGGPIAVSFIPGVGGVTAATVPPTAIGPSVGLSVLGRAASTTGAMASITATAQRQVPSTGTAGTSVAWGQLGTIMPGAPIYDVMASPYNAVGNGVADDTTAIQAAITAAGSTGGVVALGRAHMITSTLVISGDGIWVKGRGIHPNNGTKIAFNGSGSSCKAVQILGFQHSGISDCYIESSKVYSADALLEFDGTFRGFAVNISLTFGYNSIHVYRSTETWISWFQIRNPFGTRGVLFDGTASVHSYRCILETAGMDCPYPYAIAGLGAAWTAGQAVVQGNIRHNSEGIWSCSTAGTTSGAGTGPAQSSIGTTNPTTYRTTEVTDGTAKWRWVCDRNLSWVTLDSYASTLTVSKLALISGGVGVRNSNTIGGSGARGDGIIATDLEIDHAYDFGIFLEEGYDAQFHGGTVTSCQFDAGVRIGAGYGVDWTIEGMRIFGNAKHGVSVAHGSGKIQNNRIGHNGTLTSNTYDGISVDDGITRLDITGNFVGELGYTGNAQRTGIQLNGTTSDNYCVTGNVCSGNLTAGIFNGAGVATTRIVRNNVPDTTTGIIPDADYGDITVSSSATVWTIDNNTVTDAKLRDSGALSVIGRSANSTGDPADISASAASGSVLRESGSVLGFGTIATAGIAANAVTNAKLATMAAATIKGRALGAGTGDPTDLTQTQVGDMFRLISGVTDTPAPGTFDDYVVAESTKLLRMNPSSSGDVSITGFALGSTNTGGWFRLFHQGASGVERIVLKHADAGSIANNQLVLPESTDYILDRFGDCVDMQYIGGRWQVVSQQINTQRITADAVTNAKAANMAQSTIKGRAEGAGTGDPTDLTPTQVIAIVDAESPTWSASHRFDSFIQFGTSTALPSSGDIRKAGALSINSADDINITALDNSTVTVSNTLAMSGGAAVTITSTNTMALTATTTLTLTAGTSVSVPSFLGVAGAAEFSGSLTVRASQRWSTVASATLAATQNNFSAGSATACRFTLTGNQNLTGIVPDSTSEGCLMLVVNADTTDNLTLIHDATSTAANRFLLPGSTDRVLLPNAMALLWYDFSSSRWRMVYDV